MSMMTDLRARLVGDNAISGMVGTRIRMNRSEQSDTLPRIVLTQVSGDHDHHLTAAAGHASGRVQINCHASSPVEADSLAEAVRLRMDGFRGEMNSGVFVHSCHLDDERMLYDPPQEGQHASGGVDTKQLDYLIGWGVPVPNFA